MMQLKIEKSKFKEYSLDKISEALQSGLSNNYKEVEVSIVDCPNLRDWACPSEGISGNQKIIDVGGEPYMHDPNLIGAEFDYEEISKMIGSEKSYALGSGSGAMSCLEGGHRGRLAAQRFRAASRNATLLPSQRGMTGAGTDLNGHSRFGRTSTPSQRNAVIFR